MGPMTSDIPSETITITNETKIRGDSMQRKEKMTLRLITMIEPHTEDILKKIIRTET